MRVYGLTGGIASGKTEAADRLRELGFPVIDADKVGHAVIAPGGAAEARVVEAFGPGILTEGRIDRRKLGARVFADPAELARLNAIVHPEIKAEIARRCETLAREGHDVAVIDAALLAEDGKIAENTSGLILVLAPEDVRVERLVTHRGLTPDQARGRIRAQIPPESKIPLATWVIDNAGTREEFRAKIDALARSLRKPGQSAV